MSLAFYYNANILLSLAEGTSQVVATRTSLKPDSLTRAAGGDHVDALSSVPADFGGRVRAAIDAADGPAYPLLFV